MSVSVSVIKVNLCLTADIIKYLFDLEVHSFTLTSIILAVQNVSIFFSPAKLVEIPVAVNANACMRCEGQFQCSVLCSGSHMFSVMHMLFIYKLCQNDSEWFLRWHAQH